MKKELLLFAMTAMALGLFAQTNTFPASGNVGIGTTSPIGKLDVRGESYLNNIRAGIGGGADIENTAFGASALDNNAGTGFINGELVFGGSYNTAIGNLALRNNTYGTANTAVGNRASTSNTTGIYNTAVGTYASSGGNGSRNTAVGAYTLAFSTGLANTAIGSQALTSNTSGYSNTGIGQASLFTNTTGIYNTAVGDNSQFYNTSGSRNTSVGESSLFINSTGANNTAVGENSMYANTNGSYNTSVGQNSMFSNQTGYNNTSVGVNSLYYNTSGSNNTSIGYNAMDSNTTGIQNCAVGTYAMFNNRTGNYNAATGRYALYNNKTGMENTAFGDVALYYNTTGSYNTGVGYLATPGSGALSNTTTLGYNAAASASNQVRIGNNSVTSIGGFVNWTNISDGRVKKNIKENVPGLSFINQLTPVTYNLNLAEADRIIDKKMPEEELKKEKENPEVSKARTEKEKVLYSGFIAQDVEKAAKKLHYDFSGVDVPKNDKDLYGLRYAEFVVPLVKAVQELSKLNEEKDITISRQQQQIDHLQQQIDELKAMVTGDKKIPVKESISSASLQQNVPNPFSNATSIGYTLPANVSAAKIIISDKAGKTLKEINVTGKGSGSININTSALNAGAYQYSLYVNDRLIDSKQMIVTR